MTYADIRRAIAQLPGLTNQGNGVEYDLHDSDLMIASRLRASRQELEASVDVCTRVAEWLAKQPTTKAVNPAASSDVLKDLAATELGIPVSNGQFIAAALHNRLLFRPHAIRTTVYFNLALPPAKG